MDFTSFFVYFLTQWVIRIFNSVKSISQTIKADSHHLLVPDLDYGSQMSSETTTKTDKAQEPVGDQYQIPTATSDPVQEIGQQLQEMTISEKALEPVGHEGFATQKNLVHLPENRFWNPKSESRIIENDARIRIFQVKIIVFSKCR